MTGPVDWSGLVLGPIMQAFGEAVVYVSADGVVSQVTGVFRAAYTLVKVVQDTAVSSTHPILGVQLAQFAASPAQGDTLTIVRTGVGYVVAEVQPDGLGGARLILNAAQ